MKKIKLVTQAILLISTAIGLISCTTKPTILHQGESLLQTGSKRSSILFHSSLYYPNEIALNTDGFIIGVEKSPLNAVVQDKKDIRIANINFGRKFYGAQKTVADEIIDHKILYISHILENFGQTHGQKNCALYDVYRNINKNNADHLQTNACLPSQQNIKDPKQSYLASWEALDILSAALKDKIAHNDYTHIVVITMGWNTTQEEAMRNFNAILNNIYKASGVPNADGSVSNAKFKPLVIGVTWPSQFESQVLNSTVGKATSFVTKRGDADELGLTWLGVLLNKTIPAANNRKLPVVAIGHSFGARAATTATCFGPAIYQKSESELQNSEILRSGSKGTETIRKPVQYLVALQGAFSEKRILDKDGAINGVNFNGCAGAEKILMTATIHDTAVTSAIWGSYAGAKNKALITNSPRGILKYCNEQSKKLINTPNLQCAKSSAEGDLKPALNRETKVTYVDADELINKNSYLSGGGAHSDIYRYAHGKLIWNFINDPKNLNN